MTTTIHDLSSADSIASNDELVIWQRANASTRKAEMSAVAARVAELIEGEPDETQYSLATDAGGFSLAIVPSAIGGSVWAQLTLSGPAATGAIALPNADDRRNGQDVLVTVTNSVAALTVSGGDAAVFGAPASLPVNGFFKLRFDSVKAAWFRVG